MKSCSSKFKIVLVLLAGLCTAALILLGRYFLLKSDKPPETYVAEIKDVVQEVEKLAGDEGEKREERKEREEGVLPEKIFIEVPFTSQAPFGVWDERHEEACEEASLLLIAYYLEGKGLNKNIAENEIQKMIDFEIKNYGDYKDSNAEQIVGLAKDFYGIENLKIIYNFKKEDIKKELAKSNPVIIPAAGRELGNPYYTQPGPLYHMLVLVGYSGNEIITNDVGTRRGEGYRYDINVLYKAIHDFPGSKDKIKEGRKAMITIEIKNEK